MFVNEDAAQKAIDETIDYLEREGRTGPISKPIILSYAIASYVRHDRKIPDYQHINFVMVGAIAILTAVGGIWGGFALAWMLL